eukprot:scaffold2566_cov125-Alexandrium_tamarense.AAC.40
MSPCRPAGGAAENGGLPLNETMDDFGDRDCSVLVRCVCRGVSSVHRPDMIWIGVVVLRRQLNGLLGLCARGALPQLLRLFHSAASIILRDDCVYAAAVPGDCLPSLLIVLSTHSHKHSRFLHFRKQHDNSQ